MVSSSLSDAQKYLALALDAADTEGSASRSTLHTEYMNKKSQRFAALASASALISIAASLEKLASSAEV